MKIFTVKCSIGAQAKHRRCDIKLFGDPISNKLSPTINTIIEFFGFDILTEITRLVITIQLSKIGGKFSKVKNRSTQIKVSIGRNLNIDNSPIIRKG